MKLSPSIAPKIPISPVSFPFNFNNTAISLSDLQASVELPIGEDLNEWFAANLQSFHSEIYLLYDAISEFCTRRKCPNMSAGLNFEYFWVNPEDTKRPLRLPAYEYINNLMLWIDDVFENEHLFPTSERRNFPYMFVNIVKTIFNRLLRVFAHIYNSHLDDIEGLDLSLHLNTSFQHFICFVKRFSLIKDIDLDPFRNHTTKNTKFFKRK